MLLNIWHLLNYSIYYSTLNKNNAIWLLYTSNLNLLEILFIGQ